MNANLATSTPLAVVRPAMRLLFTSGGCLLLALCTAIFAAQNYLAIEAANQRLGMEAVHLSEIAPDWIVAFLPDLTLAQFTALGLTLGVGLGTFLWFHLLVRTLESLFEAMPDRPLTMLFKARWELVWLLAVTAMVILVLTFDVSLYRFRGAVDVFLPELKDKHIPTALADLATLRRKHPHLWSLQLLDVGTWGNLACAALMSLALEYAIHRLGAAWELFREVLEGIVSARTPERDALASGIRLAPQFPVVGSRPPEFVTLETALANLGRYVVHPVTGEIFDRAFLDGLSDTTRLH